MVAAARPSPISPAVLAWALAEDGRSPEDLALALKVSPDLLQAWLAGEERPTQGQVTNLGTVLQRPRALFFLPQPPAQASLPASFRHPPGDDRDVGVATRRRVRQARRVQHAISWALRDEPPLAIPRSDLTAPADAAAADVRQWLGISDSEQRAWRDDREALRAWREALDGRGVLVFALEMGRDNVRGFSAWDARAPLIVTNVSSVSPAARSYTLGHELGHLVTRRDAACVEMRDSFTGAAVERWCEHFSAALLMPPAPALALARSRLIGDGKAGLEDVKAVATAFRVSHRAAALRLIDLGLANRALYPEVLSVFRAAPPVVASPDDFRRPARSTARMREYGPRALETVLGQLPPRDALSILRVTVEDVRRIAGEVPGVPAY